MMITIIYENSLQQMSFAYVNNIVFCVLTRSKQFSRVFTFSEDMSIILSSANNDSILMTAFKLLFYSLTELYSLLFKLQISVLVTWNLAFASVCVFCIECDFLSVISFVVVLI